jgi:uncharacterized protein YjbI with pentapeptide repeats
MTTKVQIKSIQGDILFERESPNNSIKETIVACAKAKISLCNANLSGADLSWVDIRRVNLSGADLAKVTMEGSWLDFADLSSAVINDSNLDRASLLGANLQKADLSNSSMCMSRLQSADLSDAILSEVDLSRADLADANLTNVDLSSAYLSWANLENATLSHANLQYAWLERANLQYANLHFANLEYADLRWANLYKAKLYYTHMEYANLSWANLEDTDLLQTYLTGAYHVGANFKDVVGFTLLPNWIRACNTILPDGDLIVYKKIHNNEVNKDVIATLLIPKETKRTDGTDNRKCFTEFAKVLMIDGAEYGHSLDSMDIYEKEKEIRSIKYHQQISFYITRMEAEQDTLIVYKKVQSDIPNENVVIKLLVPEEAKRTCLLDGNKCRVGFVEVVGIGSGFSGKNAYHRDSLDIYEAGKIIMPVEPYAENSGGITVYMTEYDAGNEMPS